MTTDNPFDDVVITFKPEATPEEEEQFLSELAHAIMAIARHVAETEILQAENAEGQATES